MPLESKEVIIWAEFSLLFPLPRLHSVPCLHFFLARLCLFSYLRLLFLTVRLCVSISHLKFSAEFQPRESSMTLVKSFFSFVLQFSSLHDRKYNYSLQRDSKHSTTGLHKGKWCVQPVMGSLTHCLGLGLEGGQRLGTSTIWSPSDASESLWWMVFWPWALSCQSDSVWSYPKKMILVVNKGEGEQNVRPSEKEGPQRWGKSHSEWDHNHRMKPPTSLNESQKHRD